MNQVTVARSGPGKSVACAVLRPRAMRHSTVGSDASGSMLSVYRAYNGFVSDAPDIVTLPCSCRVETSRDFLGRTVGRIVERGAACARGDHQPGHVLLMPGREHARPE
jgi:hypothetical protein